MSNIQIPSIFVIGAQCTGKTTLVKALRTYFAEQANEPVHMPAIISEVARDALKRMEITREHITSSPERCLALQKAILLAQFDAEASYHDRGTWYISDRSGLDPIIYTKLFVGETAMHELLESPQWQALERNMINGFVFVCESCCDWIVDDGVRLMPKSEADWAKVDYSFRSMLRERGIAYTLVPKNLTVADRVEMVINKCGQIQGAHRDE